ncbi:hypothetical protein NQZ68_013436 [Dissostichus eleginoides]|nr:hypothetical protein NQZ68_013436 [Dissostichus eleginoides]
MPDPSVRLAHSCSAFVSRDDLLMSAKDGRHFGERGEPTTRVPIGGCHSSGAGGRELGLKTDTTSRKEALHILSPRLFWCPGNSDDVRALRGVEYGVGTPERGFFLSLFRRPPPSLPHRPGTPKSYRASRLARRGTEHCLPAVTALFPRCSFPLFPRRLPARHL